MAIRCGSIAAGELDHWAQGQKLTAMDTGDGILLKPVFPFEETSLEEVAGCLNYQGKAKSVDDMADAIPMCIFQPQYDSDCYSMASARYGFRGRIASLTESSA